MSISERSLRIAAASLLLFVFQACTHNLEAQTHLEKKEPDMETEKFEVTMSDEEWKEKLTGEEFYVLRQKGTERAFTGEYWNHKGEGTYVCAGCKNALFSSETKYDSGSGWPSFWQPINKDQIATEQDTTFGMVRTEVVCGRCGSHLGHVFKDGPRPTGLRYCINSVSLDFEAGDSDKKKD